MKRKYNFIIEETEINHEYYIIKQREIIYNDKQEIEYYKQDFTFNYRPKKRIKMTKRKNEEQNNELIVKGNESFINVLQETKKMTAYEKGKWFERKVNEKLKSGGMVTTPSSDGYYDKRKGYVMTGDGGIDISGHHYGKQFIIQCKCHQEPIPATVVRDMIGLISMRKNVLGIICAIKFSPNAINEALNSKGKIILTTINNITERIQAFTSQNFAMKRIRMTYNEAKEIECTNDVMRIKEMTNGEINLEYD